MSAIKGVNTKPELLIRKALHKAGFRYTLHAKNLAGRPDLVFPKYRAIIFINGCFWHRHSCSQFKWPKSKEEFWVPKINRNAENDIKNLANLRTKNWRVAVVWECALRGKSKKPFPEILEQISAWLKSGAGELEIAENSIHDLNT